MIKQGIIDRFEGDLAVIEVDGETIVIPRSKLPNRAKSGDVVVIDGTAIRVDASETNKRKKEINDLMDELFE